MVARREKLSPDYLRIYEHNMGVIYEQFATKLNERSSQQDRHLRDKLADLRAELNTLIKQGKEPVRFPPR